MLRFVILAALCGPAALAAQFPTGGAADFDKDYWYDVLYPKAFYTPRDGFTVGGYAAFHQPVRFDDYGAPQPYRAAVSLNAQASTKGSRFVVLSGRFPQFVEGWRFVGTLGVRRDARDDYYGIGNETTYNSNNVTSAAPDYYRVRQTRWSARVEAQRYLTDHLRLLGGVDAQRWRFQPLDGPSVFASDVTVGINGIVTTDGVTDVAFRAGLVFDTRNDEVFAERGVLLQVIGAAADPDLVGESSYTRLTFRAQGHLPITERLNVAGRVVAQGLGGSPGLGTLYVIDEQEIATIGFGGASSHRALRNNRFVGRDMMLTNLDVRYAVYTIPTLIRVTAVGFLDAGRVFENESFKLTTDGLAVGGGAGTFAQIGRVGVVGMTAGIGPDGVVFNLHTRWPF